MPTCLQQRTRVRTASAARRSGFTLVEILVVIAIIGVLVALAVPAVNMAYKSIKKKAIAMECQAIAQAVEAYRTKYNDYPPDGADPTILARHLRKAFQNISPTEVALISGTFPLPSGNLPVASGTLSGSLMDPSEALVFFLGGFSDDPVFPFSGPGGPFIIMDNSSPAVQVKSNHPTANISSVQYSPDRQNPLYPFKQAQLTLAVVGGLTASSEDAELTGGTPDLLPTYHPAGLKMPFVYFDSRTYQQSTVANRFATLSAGIVYPYRSTAINTKYSAADNSVASRNRYFRFVNEKTFQVVSAGLDDNYGGQDGLFYMFKPAGGESTGSANSGDSLDLTASISSGTHPAPQFTRFNNSQGTAQADNVTNFSEGTLEDSLSN